MFAPRSCVLFVHSDHFQFPLVRVLAGAADGRGEFVEAGWISIVVGMGVGAGVPCWMRVQENRMEAAMKAARRQGNDLRKTGMEPSGKVDESWVEVQVYPSSFFLI